MIVFDFSDPKPEIENGEKYYLVIAVVGNYGSGGTFGVRIHVPAYESPNVHAIYYTNDNGVTLDDPLTNDGNTGWLPYMYCSYSEGGGNNAPIITGEVPANTSTGISLTPTCNVTVTDADAEAMDVTWASNYLSLIHI